jgi:mono/diheme cytochrome c family protein
MPKLFDATPQGVAERYAVTRYLIGNSDLKESKPNPLERGYQRSLEAGKALFTTTGCAACHGPKLAGAMKATDDDDDKPAVKPDVMESFAGYGSATGVQARYALGGLGSKTTAEALARYLRNPLHTNPGGRMPDLLLSADESRDLARHLVRFTEEAVADKTTLKPPAISAKELALALKNDKLDAFVELPADQQWHRLGRQVFLAKGCANCHAREEEGKALPPQSMRSLKDLKNVSSGCVATKVERGVDYHLDDAQRAALHSFLRGNPERPAASHYETRAALKRFNCLNCHSRDGEGGIGTELADAMKKADSAANEDDVAPPRLTGIGHKATPEWLTKVLLKGERARPWMPLRMPQYGEANVAHLVAGLPALEGHVAPAKSATKPTAALINAGRKLVGKEGLGCIACHDISGVAAGGTRGPDLALTSARMQDDWLVRWMHNPQRLAPGTKMPQNFTDGKSVNAMLGGDANAQITAINAYLSLGRGLPLPVGIEPPNKGLALVVKHRPEVLRTFMPESPGTRPIAVGFPQNAGAYVFDSHACRTAYAWEGNFLDVGPVWNNRGGFAAKLLGAKFWTAPPGQPWAVTDGVAPDFEARASDFAYGASVPWQQNYAGPMRVHFNGYKLDTAGVPSFDYTVDSADGAASVKVIETTVPVKSPIASGLKRGFVIERPAGKTVWLAISTHTGPLRATPARVVLPQASDRALLAVIGTLPEGAEWVSAKSLAVLKLPPVKVAVKSPVEFTLWSVPRDDEALFEAIIAEK